jgi:hypothetical protein
MFQNLLTYVAIVKDAIQDSSSVEETLMHIAEDVAHVRDSEIHDPESCPACAK